MLPEPFRKPRARELAMQVLFLWDANGNADNALARSAMLGTEGSEIADEETIKLGIEMAQGAWEHRKLSDDWIGRLAPQWPPHRQPSVDRNILRLAVWEMTHKGTPPRVAIDEAIELAKRFSTENSPGFVNGLLDAVLKEIRNLKSEAPPVVEEGTHAEGTKAQRHEGTKDG